LHSDHPPFLFQPEGNTRLCLSSVSFEAMEIESAGNPKLKYIERYMIYQSAGATIQSTHTLRNKEMNSNVPPAEDIIEKQKAVFQRIFFFLITNCQIIVMFCLYINNSLSMADMYAAG